MNEIKKVKVFFDEVQYDIIFGEGVLDNISEYIKQFTKNNKIIIVSDVFFKNSVGMRIEQLLNNSEYEVFTYYMHAGKGNKNLNEVLKIYSILEENNFARDSVLIALGGGVIGDLAGFVASTWLRGMNLIHVPTTLMAMVDSSIGGKVAINFRQTINAVGNYYHPVCNIMDLNFIKSLPDRDYYSGIAEVIKCAIINDRDFYNYLWNEQELIHKRAYTHLVEFILRTIEIKVAHVNGDLREGNKRLLLNYGHTLGHAIEISTEKNHQEQLRHGEGVSIGIIAAAYIAEQYIHTASDILSSHEELFLNYQLPINISATKLGFTRKSLIKKCCENVRKDKKRKDNNIRVILSKGIGTAEIFDDVPFPIIEAAFEYVIKQ